jgi:hypothetical protein
MQKTGVLVAALGLALLAAPARAQGGFSLASDDAWCDDDGRWGDESVRHCEVREATWAGGAGATDVDAGPNGGIEVRGWDRHEVRVRAKVVAVAPTAAEAADLAGQVRIGTSGQVHATGPRGSRRGHWWVSYRLDVPRQARLSLRSVNGGISLRDVAGTADLATTNGGLHLRAVGGRVTGRTTNGGLDVELAGAAWAGEGLDVETTNGGVNLSIPAGYNARVETGTTNGGLDVDFPLTLQGRINRKHLSFDVGKGGALVRAMTTNGGVQVRRN